MLAFLHTDVLEAGAVTNAIRADIERGLVQLARGGARPIVVTCSDHWRRGGDNHARRR